MTRKRKKRAARSRVGVSARSIAAQIRDDILRGYRLTRYPSRRSTKYTPPGDTRRASSSWRVSKMRAFKSIDEALAPAPGLPVLLASGPPDLPEVPPRFAAPPPEVMASVGRKAARSFPKHAVNVKLLLRKTVEEPDTGELEQVQGWASLVSLTSRLSTLRDVLARPVDDWILSRQKPGGLARLVLSRRGVLSLAGLSVYVTSRFVGAKHGPQSWAPVKLKKGRKKNGQKRKNGSARKTSARHGRNRGYSPGRRK